MVEFTFTTNDYGTFSILFSVFCHDVELGDSPFFEWMSNLSKNWIQCCEFKVFIIIKSVNNFFPDNMYFTRM